MKALPTEEREELIAEADNVLGYERFIERSKQVALREAYRRGSNDGPKT